jgi:hypothetical protein
VQSNYKTTKGDGRAFHFVKPLRVCTLEFTDVIADDSAGKPIYRMALSYNAAWSTWETIRSVPFVSAISPRFKAMRGDTGFPSLPNEGTKEVKYPDLRIEQILSLISLDTEIKSVAPIKLEDSTILARIVFKGEWHGSTSVKKTLLIKTNKEQDESYPAFIVYGIDYSPTRARPVQGLESGSHQDVLPFTNQNAAIRYMNQLLITSMLSEDSKTKEIKKPYRVKNSVKLYSVDLDTSIIDPSKQIFDNVFAELSLFKDALKK